MGTIQEFYQALYDFHRLKDDKWKYDSIESLCAKAKDYFNEELEKVAPIEFLSMRIPGDTPDAKKSGLTTWLDGMIKDINDCVKKESDNKLEAPQELYNLLFDEEKNVHKYQGMLTTIDRNTDFYRIREAEKYALYDRKGMFILPDKLENKVGTYRFNPSGYASLYLASNLYLSWEECRRPDFDTFNFSRFQNTRSVNVLNVVINKEYKYQGHFLMSYLALLCCAKTTDKDKHNFQYVVPQMLMKVLCHSQAKKVHEEIAGIKYTSSRRYDQKDFLFPDITRLTHAYVFPQQEHGEEYDVCPYLGKLFRLTEPRTYFLYKTRRFDFYDRKAFASDYQDTLFYQLEEELKKEELGKYDE